MWGLTACSHDDLTLLSIYFCVQIWYQQDSGHFNNFLSCEHTFLYLQATPLMSACNPHNTSWLFLLPTSSTVSALRTQPPNHEDLYTSYGEVTLPTFGRAHPLYWWGARFKRPLYSVQLVGKLNLKRHSFVNSK